MRRNRGTAINITLFSVALLGILYFNFPSKTSTRPKLFAWTRIRYESTSKATSPSLGVCPGLSNTVTKPVLVVARIESESSSWLDELSSIYHVCRYTADAVRDLSSTNLQTPENRGHESMAYLTFLIDNYDNLPSTGMVFVHGSRFSWHNDDPLYDNLSLLKQLDVKRALWGPPGLPTGYWNLKCDWSAGMCDTKSEDAKPQGSLETRTRAMLERNNKRAASDVALVQALQSIFGGHSDNGRVREGELLLPTTLGRSDAVRSQCCAQFAVAKENVFRHTKNEYIALRQWLLDGSAEKSEEANQGTTDQTRDSRYKSTTGRPTFNHLAAPADDLIAGRILSYIWHILFLPAASQNTLGLDNEQSLMDSTAVTDVGVDLSLLNTLACPSAEECYCRLYGRCNLPGCTTPGHCRGQYRVPLGYKLPKDWAEKHS